MVYNGERCDLETCQDGKLELEFEIKEPAFTFLERVKDRLLSILLDMIHGDPYVRPPSAARWINQLFRQERPICEIPDDFFKLTHEENVANARVKEKCTGERAIAVETTILRAKLTHPNHLQNNGVRDCEVEDENIEPWANLHAFIAELVGRGFLQLRYVGILMFHDAFEEDSTGNNQEAHLQVLGQWIRHAGSAMFCTLNKPVPTTALEGVDTTGYLYSGEGGFCPARWSFWIKRAFELSTKIHEDLRPLVLGTAHWMVDISVLGASELMAIRGGG